MYATKQGVGESALTNVILIGLNLKKEYFRFITLN